jgi:acyl-CoA thioester hydrolase
MAGQELMETLRGRVAQQECDFIGHMNVQFYIARISDATTTLNAAIGIDVRFMREQRRALVTLGQDVAYLRELRAGDLVVMHSGIVAIEGKKVRYFHRLSRVEDGEIAMTARQLMIGMDLVRRKAILIDDEILERARAMLVAEAAA